MIAAAFFLSTLLFATHCHALIPATPAEQTARAIKSLKSAIASSSTPPRFYVDYLIPLPPETVAADIDPWPGGLAQMYPYAEDILKEILKGITEKPAAACSSQVISQEDCAGFFIQESVADAKHDVAAILFPGVDQLEKIAEIDAMVGDQRTLILFNKQFRRPADFGFQESRSKKVVFDRFQPGFCFQEFAVRGEDCKLLYEAPGGWAASVILDDNVDVGRQEIALFDSLTDRPIYDELDKKINQVLPEPLWMRKMGEAQTKGFKFQRGS